MEVVIENILVIYVERIVRNSSWFYPDITHV